MRINANFIRVLSFCLKLHISLIVYFCTFVTYFEVTLKNPEEENLLCIDSKTKCTKTYFFM